MTTNQDTVEGLIQISREDLEELLFDAMDSADDWSARSTGARAMVDRYLKEKS